MFTGALQPMHLVLVLVIVLIVFGPGKLPELGSSLGKSLSEFKRATSGDPEPAKDVAEPAAEAKPQAPIALKSAPEMASCRACGHQNPSGNAFCGACGSKLN